MSIHTIDNHSLDGLRRSREELESALRVAGAEFRGRSVKCPFHEDRDPSAGVYQRPDDVWAFKCHACGINEDIIGVRARIAGKNPADVLRDLRKADRPKPPRVFPSVEALLESIGHWASVETDYRYADPDAGNVQLVVVRCRDSNGKKAFIQASRVEGGFVQKAPKKPWPLYNRHRMTAAQEVVVVEGEKCVHALHDAGVVATTSPGGAGNARSADWSPLAGKTVYLWPDHDANGLQYMRDVAEEAQKLEPQPRLLWLDPAEFNLPEKADVVEYLAEYGGDTPERKHEAVRSALEQARAFGPSAAVRKLLEDTISGARSAVPWPWPTLASATNALLPGGVTLLCGEPGSHKSFFLLQAARYWWDQKCKFALYQLEEDEEGAHLLRALVQQSCCTELLNPTFVKNNAEFVRDAYKAHGMFLDSFGASLTTPPKEPPPLADLVDWIRDRAKDGCRVICIDPITAAESTDKPWAADKKFILNAKTVVRDYGVSLVLVTHPRRGSKGTLEDVAGGWPMCSSRRPSC